MLADVTWEVEERFGATRIDHFSACFPLSISLLARGLQMLATYNFLSITLN